MFTTEMTSFFTKYHQIAPKEMIITFASSEILERRNTLSAKQRLQLMVGTSMPKSPVPVSLSRHCPVSIEKCQDFLTGVSPTGSYSQIIDLGFLLVDQNPPRRSRNTVQGREEDWRDAEHAAMTSGKRNLSLAFLEHPNLL